jgi:hypothetical protein
MKGVPIEVLEIKKNARNSMGLREIEGDQSLI